MSIELRVYTRRKFNSNTENNQVNLEHDQLSAPSSQNPGNLPMDSTPLPIFYLNIPIAIRKGVRNCTKYLIAKYLSYQRLSRKYRAFTPNISHLFIPRTIQEALGHSEWRSVVQEKMNALLKNRTWDIVDLPKEKKTVGCKWVFTIKCKPNGSIERYKATLVDNGFTQTYGIDHQETFAPFAKINSIRILLSLGVHFNWPLHQLDVKNTFLNGDLEEEVFMDLPLGFEETLEKRKKKRFAD